MGTLVPLFIYTQIYGKGHYVKSFFCFENFFVKMALKKGKE